MNAVFNDDILNFARQAIAKLVNDERKVYLDFPYAGFYVAFTPEATDSDKAQVTKSIKEWGFENGGEKNVTLVCENLTGKI